MYKLWVMYREMPKKGYFIMDVILDFIKVLRWQDFIDILIIAIVAYYIIGIIKDTRAMQLAKAIIILIVFQKVAEILGLYTITYILSIVMQFGFLAIFIIFQPELRQALERLGNSRVARYLKLSNSVANDDTSKKVSKEITQAIEYLSERKTGALIVIERQTKLGNVISTGVPLNSEISSELLCNIFTPLAPLHDGAVVVRNEKIVAASCLLPNSQRTNLDSGLGTRHRAAIGVSEVSDALVVVVSEESGRISIAVNGIISRGISISTVEGTIQKLFAQEVRPASAVSSRVRRLWRHK